MNELALFAGAGGGILGGKLLGWRTVCAVEWEPYPASVLCARQNDGLLPPFPIWDDVQTFDGRPWRGIVDVVSGGFPCQDISAAGKGAGIDGERSGMWSHMARVVGEVRPRYVFVENSPMLVTRGLERVLGDLTALGYDTKWTVMGAADVGANHQRDRIWIVANANNARIERREQQSESSDGKGDMAYTSMSRFSSRDNSTLRFQKFTLEKQFGRGGYEFGAAKHWWEVEPNVGRVADGVAARVDRLKAIGNGQVPLCAATAWKVLNEL
jgi:DNA (cytosine-5)-methyltransferase 1